MYLTMPLSVQYNITKLTVFYFYFNLDKYKNINFNITYKKLKQTYKLCKHNPITN